MKAGLSLQPIVSDGSDRLFSRTEWNGEGAVMIRPSPGRFGAAEARSYVDIGRHLWAAGVPVPEIYSFDPDSGFIVVEDLGDRHVQAEVMARASSGDWDGVDSLYRGALKILAHMQIVGGRGFDARWCCDTSYYDSQLALRREVNYFLEFFVERFMGQERGPDLEQELGGLSRRVDFFAGRDFFLHRDFQSRNILLKDGALRVVDFQGGRLGPLGYDTAALLLDPYVQLPASLLPGLLSFYMDELKALGYAVGADAFRREFRMLALLRTLQVLGAFAYLTLVKGKAFFGPYIGPALRNLGRLTFHEDFSELVHLRTWVASVLEERG
jgi:aminoglycoside/choline kinase family phosphotransferase